MRVFLDVIDVDARRGGADRASGFVRRPIVLRHTSKVRSTVLCTTTRRFYHRRGSKPPRFITKCAFPRLK